VQILIPAVFPLPSRIFPPELKCTRLLVITFSSEMTRRIEISQSQIPLPAFPSPSRPGDGTTQHSLLPSGNSEKNSLAIPDSARPPYRKAFGSRLDLLRQPNSIMTGNVPRRGNDALSQLLWPAEQVAAYFTRRGLPPSRFLFSVLLPSSATRRRVFFPPTSGRNGFPLRVPGVPHPLDIVC